MYGQRYPRYDSEELSESSSDSEEQEISVILDTSDNGNENPPAEDSLAEVCQTCEVEYQRRDTAELWMKLEFVSYCIVILVSLLYICY